MKILVNTYKHFFKSFCAPKSQEALQNKLSFVSAHTSNKKNVFSLFKEIFNVELKKINISRAGQLNNQNKRVTVSFKTPNDFRNFLNTLKHYINANKHTKPKE